MGSYGILCDFEQEKTWGGLICCDMNNGVAMITSTGIGFTFIQNDKNSVYVFANGKGDSCLYRIVYPRILRQSPGYGS